MKVREEEIEEKRTKNGGWTKDQLAQWGVPWPPPKGWKKALISGNPMPGAEWIKDDIILRILDSLPKEKGS